MSTTRIIHLHRGADRNDASNDVTCVGQWSELRQPAGPGLHAGFLAHWSVMARECAAVTAPALVVVVADERGVAGTMRLTCHRTRPNVAVLGRHGHSDVFLPTDRDLSLRHLMVLTLPHRGGDRPLRYRLIDLKTRAGIVDERGEAVGALEADGPLFVRCASYGIYVFPVVPGQAEWPADPDAAWKAMPARRYHDRPELRGGVSSSARDLEITDVRTLPQPSAPSSRPMRVSDGVLGELCLQTSSARTAFVLGARHACDGVLIGRYARCLHRSVPFRMPRAVSRVHSLILMLDGTLYAIDTGSRNGQWFEGERVRVHPLGGEEPLELGRDTLWLRWRAAH